MKIVNFNLKEFEDFKNKKWMLGNNILYNLCEKYPKHNKKEEIRAKIWLIGRAYAASIERRRLKKRINDDFYDYVTKEFIKFNKKEKFDEKLSEIKNSDFNKNILKLVLEVHYQLTKFFKELTGLEKRSLASKYLHFHVPIFPIYDSRAKRSLNKVVKGRIKSSNLIVDREYSKFCEKMLFLYEHIKKEMGKKPTLREIDTYLVGIANKKLKGNN